MAIDSSKNAFFKGSCVTNYTKKRYYLFLLITCITFVLPWITVDGNHLFLLSFDHKQLHLMFKSFSTQEFFLMPFILIFFFLFIFFITTLGGRIWCGWSCPQTIFRVIYRDLIQTKLLKIRNNIANKQQPEKDEKFKKIIAIALFSVIALIASSNFIWYFVPPEDFFEYLKNINEHKLVFGIVLGFTIFLIFDIVFLQEKFCVYVCPYARVQSTMFDNDTIQVIYDEKRGGKIYDEHKNMISNKPETGDCVGCQACVRICPTHIDIRKGMQLECINCLECADACSKVMDKLGKKSLVNWSSENSMLSGNKIKFFRFRTVAYMVVLTVVLIALGFMTTTKKTMLLNVNRTTELYKLVLHEDKKLEVINNYTFLFENTDRKDHKFFFEVLQDDIEIKQPKDEIKLSAGKKRQIIVRLSTKNLDGIDNERQDVIKPITIRAYATDEKDKIFIEKQTIFAYPKKEIIQKELQQ